MAVRSALHQAGAAALTELLHFAAPTAGRRTLPCSCGQQTHYRELRSKPVLTAVGKVQVSRPYYLCSHCHAGQFPADVELDIENTEFSPGVRRMQAVVGQEAPFDHGRQQMKLLADLEVTAKSVERTAEAIGADIAEGEQQEIQCALQLNLPTTPIHDLIVHNDDLVVATHGRSFWVLDPLPPRRRQLPCYSQGHPSPLATALAVALLQTATRCPV